MKKEIICICCPNGCYLTVDYAETAISSIYGNRCEAGLKYAEKEVFSPERTLTTTMKVNHGQFPLVSVKTEKPIPKSMIFDTMDLLSKAELEAPIKIGGIVLQNIFNTGVNIVATKNVPKNTQNIVRNL